MYSTNINVSLKVIRIKTDNKRVLKKILLLAVVGVIILQSLISTKNLADE